MYQVIGAKQICSIINVTLKAAKKFEGVMVYWEERNCVVPENIQTPPTEGFLA